MDIRFEFHLHVHGAHGDVRLVQPGSAHSNPDSPEADLRRLFGEAYGDGNAIPLSKDDPCFAEKQAALKAALRVWDSKKGRWVHRP